MNFPGTVNLGALRPDTVVSPTNTLGMGALFGPLVRGWYWLSIHGEAGLPVVVQPHQVRFN
jgi:hypothetical protein